MIWVGESFFLVGGNGARGDFTVSGTFLKGNAIKKASHPDPIIKCLKSGIDIMYLSNKKVWLLKCFGKIRSHSKLCPICYDISVGFFPRDAIKRRFGCSFPCIKP